MSQIRQKRFVRVLRGDLDFDTSIFFCTFVQYFVTKLRQEMKLSIHLKPKDPHFFYVYVSLSHNSQRVLISTKYIISSKDVKKGKIINVSKNAEIYTEEILKYQRLIDEIPAIDVLTSKNIKNIITSKKIDSSDVIDFFAFAKSYIDDLSAAGRKGTATSYKYSLASFQRYIKRAELYTFEMTSNMLQQYIKELIINGKSAKSIDVYITHLKVLFNACRDAYNDYDTGAIKIKNYPFKKLNIPAVEVNTGQKAISVEDLKNLIALSVPENLAIAKDMFLLSFYLLGMNMIDMYSLTKKSYKEGHITYCRQKTIRRTGSSMICIPVCEQAEELINKYQGHGAYLLRLADKYQDAKSITSVLSVKMDKLYELLHPNIDKKHFTMYSARHTWASIAANECHFSDAEVARALNHQSEHKVTRGYIRPDWSLLDRMHEAVMAVVFG